MEQLAIFDAPAPHCTGVADPPPRSRVRLWRPRKPRAEGWFEEAPRPTRFYLGTHEESWLESPRFVNVPLFISRSRLHDRVRLPRAVTRWALDSQGFTQLQMYGCWTVSPEKYADEVRRYRDEIGLLDWAAPQDWMCEEIVIKGGKVRHNGRTIVYKGTGLSVAEHQRRTVENYLKLRTIAPDVPWAPVLQGWSLCQYIECLQMYERAGIDLRREPIVGVGTMCRREHTIAAGHILGTLASDGLKLHGFGFKTEGLRSYKHLLASADSLAWSDHALHQDPLEGHDQPDPAAGRRFGHKRCNNCPDFALLWRERIVADLRAQALAA